MTTHIANDRWSAAASRPHPTRVAGFDAAERTAIADVAARAEDDHADTLGFVARVLARGGASAGGGPHGRAAVEVVEPDGVTLRLETGATATQVRLAFATAVTDVHTFWRAMLELLTRARAAAPDAPTTSLEEEIAAYERRDLHRGTVATVRRLSARVRAVEVRVHGTGSLGRTGGDAFLTLAVPATRNTPLPDLRRPSDLASAFAEGAVAAATYTVRRWDPATRMLVLWVVDHGHRDGVGRWSRRAARGDDVVVSDARRTVTFTDDTVAVLLAGDETAAPAIAALLDELPSSTRATVLTLAQDDDTVRLPLRDGDRRVAVTDDGPEALADAVRGLDLDPAGLSVFAAAETRVAAALRVVVRGELGLPRERAHVSAYWRRSA